MSPLCPRFLFALAPEVRVKPLPSNVLRWTPLLSASEMERPLAEGHTLTKLLAQHEDGLMSARVNVDICGGGQGIISEISCALS